MVLGKLKFSAKISEFSELTSFDIKKSSAGMADKSKNVRFGLIALLW